MTGFLIFGIIVLVAIVIITYFLLDTVKFSTPYATDMISGTVGSTNEMSGEIMTSEEGMGKIASLLAFA